MRKAFIDTVECATVYTPTSDVVRRNVATQTEETAFPLRQASPEVLSTSHRDNDLFYPIQSNPKGHVLLISNEIFDEMAERFGASKDVHDMVSLWEMMGCEIITKRNLSAAELLTSVKDFAEYSITVDFYVLIIMSNGKEDDLVVGSDKGAVQVGKIVKAIAKSDRMRGKPKLLFFQMSRGSRVQTETSVGSASIDNVGSTRDILLAFATQPGCVSFRDPKNGSWFIQSIKKVFVTHARTCDVRKLMGLVQQEMTKYTAYAPGRDYHGAKEFMDFRDTFGRKALHLYPEF